ncbi:hypothetical protein CGZ80_12085 [Rhodopirellula sp. MGV]|nr:hypothetical protein CGZ80_12085 [Rhodopirellula sp. MGV]PNY34047.1 hypothetical protein C2E31_25440 [Rhodopirellula baltica]
MLFGNQAIVLRTDVNCAVEPIGKLSDNNAEHRKTGADVLDVAIVLAGQSHVDFVTRLIAAMRNYDIV